MRILLVEDDRVQSAILTKVLEANRYRLDLAADGQAGLELATAVDYDLLLLDVGLPKLDGIRLCQTLRSQGYSKPILLMTARDADADVVAGFEAGADDYISKPCAPEVLLARLRTLLRRSGTIVPNATTKNSTTLTWNQLSLDFNAGRVAVGEQVVMLTATEYNLLELFLRHPNRVFSRSAILDQLWGLEDAPTDRSIVTHIKDLRKKLKAGGLANDLIETVYGMGYRLKPAPPPADSKSPVANALSTSYVSKLDQLRERFRDTFVQQVAVLEQARVKLLAGELPTTLQQEAQREAHKLSGSLAPFGYPDGSKFARLIEYWLTHTAPFTAEEISRYSDLVLALQKTLTEPPVPLSPPLTSSDSPDLHTAHSVLIIGDDQDLIQQLKAEAPDWGVQLEIVANLTEAQPRLAQSSPEVILLDLSPDAADQLTLLQEIRAQTPHLPVIVLAGQDSLSDRLAVSRSGARQFLHKPATTEQIFRAIIQVLPVPKTAEARVLIVDDDPAALGLLSSLLTPWGLKVVTLSEPQRFWEILTATSPNLILLDLEMPDVSGLELCRVVRQDVQWGDLPILVVTAHTDADALRQAFAAGADDFIAKPVLGPELVTRTLSRIERTRVQINPNNPNPNNPNPNNLNTGAPGRMQR